jgi:hypothetical protein
MTRDSRVTRAITLLREAPSINSPLVDDAIELMEALCDELPAARQVVEIAA